MPGPGGGGGGRGGGVCAAVPRVGTLPPLPAAAALRLSAGLAHSPRSLPPGGAERGPRLRNAAAWALRQLCGVVLPSAAGGESGPGARGQCARARRARGGDRWRGPLGGVCVGGAPPPRLPSGAHPGTARGGGGVSFRRRGRV